MVDKNEHSYASLDSIRSMVLMALFAALIAGGAQLSIPIGPVPIVLTNLFVLLAGLLLGPRYAAGSVALYLLLGAIGLPVFAQGKGGIAHFLGPTGGFLFGFLAAAIAMSFVRVHLERLGRNDSQTPTVVRPVPDITAVVIATLIVYLLGVPWLKVVTGMTWTRSIAAGMTPFLIGDALKMIAAVSLSWTLRPALRTSAEQSPSEA